MKLKIISIVFLVAVLIIIAWPKIVRHENDTLTFNRLPIPVPSQYSWMDNTHVLTIDRTRNPLNTVKSTEIYTGTVQQIGTFKASCSEYYENSVSPDGKYWLQAGQDMFYILSLNDGKIETNSNVGCIRGVRWQKDDNWEAVSVSYGVDYKILRGNPRTGINYMSKTNPTCGTVILGINNHDEVITADSLAPWFSKRLQPVHLDFPYEKQEAILSPDGRQIAWVGIVSDDPQWFLRKWIPFIRYHPKEVKYLYLSNSRGANLRQIGRFPGGNEVAEYHALQWTPDGRKLGFRDNNGYLNMLDVTGK